MKDILLLIVHMIWSELNTSKLIYQGLIANFLQRTVAYF